MTRSGHCPMKSFRLNRLFHPRSRRCFDVAIDHGFFNEHSFLGGIENMERAVGIVAEAAPDAMIISSEDGQISLVNSQAETIFRCRREDLVGHNIRAIVPEWSCLSSLNGSPRELSAVRKDEGMFPAEISLSPLQTEEGLLVISAIRDMTDRKTSMDAIHQLNLTLERRVAERTQELFELNESLRHSNEDLNQFAYAASHDLQEPLRMVSL